MKQHARILALWLLTGFLAGCALFHHKKMVVWETQSIPRSYQVIGPVSVTDQVKENREDLISGLAGYITKDGRISDQVPADIKTALEAKREKHKDEIYDKLRKKAKEYGADAVIGAEYSYIPPIASLSSKATLSAKGLAVKYTK